MTTTRPLAPRSPSLGEFAAGIVHELRTPLTALSGEVELALRRERSVAYYREALARIAERTAELLDLTGDLAFIGCEAHAAMSRGPAVTSLHTAFESLRARYERRGNAMVSIGPVDADTWVQGDRAAVTGAIAVLIELVLRTRRHGARIHLRADEPPRGAGEPWGVELSVEADPGGMWPLDGEGGRGITAANQMALAAAANALEHCGGSVAAVPFAGGDGLRVRLRRVDRPGAPER